MFSTHTNNGYIVRLERGEDVGETLRAFCTEKGVTAGELRAIGAIEDLVIGSYDLESKTYDQRSVPGILEAVAVMGNIALVDDEPFLHIHGVFSNAELQCVGGHVFSMTTAVTLEVFITPHDTEVVRELDEAIGLKLCTFPQI